MRGRHVRLEAALFALALAAAVGCKETDDASGAGTDTGGSQGDSSGSDTSDNDPCIATEHPMGFEEETPLGFSARDAVDGVAGPHATQLEWLEPVEPHLIEVEPAGEIVDLTLDVSYEGGEVLYIDLEPNPESDATPERCEPLLLVDVVVGFTTSDGRFAEHIDTKLHLRSLDFVQFLLRKFNLDAMNGTFSRDDIPISYPDEFHGLSVIGWFEEGAAFGRMHIGFLLYEPGGPEVGSSATVAVWPPA
jgi:hypothetical protein